MKLSKKLLLYFLMAGMPIILVYLFIELIFPGLMIQQVEGRIEQYKNIIQKYAQESNIPEELIMVVIEIESRGRPDGVSNKGAVGLMQVMPATMRDVVARLRIPEGDLKEPDFNIRVGTAYLRMMLNQFKGEIWLALAAYHAGPTRVRQWMKKLPGRSAQEVIEKGAYKQTVWYVKTVLKKQQKYRESYK